MGEPTLRSRVCAVGIFQLAKRLGTPPGRDLALLFLYTPGSGRPHWPDRISGLVVLSRATCGPAKVGATSEILATPSALAANPARFACRIGRLRRSRGHAQTYIFPNLACGNVQSVDININR